jgi:sporulation protein YlmC with PRC-barrel domain
MEQNIPEGTIAVKEGAKVYTAEEKYVGKVERIVADLPEDQASHLLISKGLLAEERKLVPITWVQRIGEENIYLNVNKDSLEELASFQSESS